MSTPLHCALPPLFTSVKYGSGWTRKRYQLSSCDSMPQPDSPAPPTSSVKSPMSVSVLPAAPACVMVWGGVTADLPAFPRAGNQLRNPPPSGSVASASAAPDPSGAVRLMRWAWSSLYALTTAPDELVTMRSGSQT